MKYLILFNLIILLLSIYYLFKKGRYDEYRYALLALLASEFIYEITMFITSFLKMNNHMVSNFYSLINVLLTFSLLFHISLRNNGKMIKISYYILLFSLLFAWLFENLIVFDLFSYNFYFPAFGSMIAGFFAIYVINNISYYREIKIFKDSESLILSAIIFSSLLSSFLLMFLNFRFDFSIQFYKTLIFILSVIATISHVTIFYAILCLPKKIKYTWQ